MRRCALIGYLCYRYSITVSGMVFEFDGLIMEITTTEFKYFESVMCFI